MIWQAETSMFSVSYHRPPHLYLDDTWYMVTAHTLGHTPILVSEEHFEVWQNTFQELTAQFSLTVAAWVVLPNHYHTLMHLPVGNHLGEFVQRFHGRTSRAFNQLDERKGRKIWYTYWDQCIRDESTYWTRFNYIHYNPVKHGYATGPSFWRYSSYLEYLNIRGQSWLDDCWLHYPVAESLTEEIEK